MNLLPWPPELLEPISGLGRVRTKRPSPTIYWAHSFPVRARIPAPPLPLVRWNIRGDICKLLVPRGSGTQLTTNCKELCAAGKCQQIWDVLQLSRIIQVIRFGCRPVTSDYAHPAKSSVPDSLAPSPSWSRSTQSPTGSSYLHTTEYTPRSMYHSLNLTTHLSLSSQILNRLRNHPSLPPLILEDGTAYTVKEILNSRLRGGRLEYLVDWEGYGPEERSWEPRDNIIDPNLLETCHVTHPDRPAPRGRGRPPRRRGSRPSGAGRGGGGGVLTRISRFSNPANHSAPIHLSINHPHLQVTHHAAFISTSTNSLQCPVSFWHCWTQVSIHTLGSLQTLLLTSCVILSVLSSSSIAVISVLPSCSRPRISVATPIHDLLDPWDKPSVTSAQNPPKYQHSCCCTFPVHHSLRLLNIPLTISPCVWESFRNTDCMALVCVCVCVYILICINIKCYHNQIKSGRCKTDKPGCTFHHKMVNWYLTWNSTYIFQSQWMVSSGLS